MDDNVSGASATIKDTAGSNNGTTYGANIDCTVPGKYGTGCSFKGAEYISAGDINDLDGASQFTISLWTFLRTRETWDGIIAKSLNDNSRTLISQTPSDGQIYYFVGNGSNPYGGLSSAYSFNQWAHFTMVFNGNGADNEAKLKVYINGQNKSLTYNGTIPSVTSDNAANLVMGAERASYRMMDGILDDGG